MADQEFEYRLLCQKRRYTPETGWGEWGEWEVLKGYNRPNSYNYPSLRAVKIAMRYYRDPQKFYGGITDERRFRIQRRPLSPDWEEVELDG
jgi:hypothetical protein